MPGPAKSAQYQERADEVIAMALNTPDRELREVLVGMADDYEFLAMVHRQLERERQGRKESNPGAHISN